VGGGINGTNYSYSEKSNSKASNGCYLTQTAIAGNGGNAGQIHTDKIVLVNPGATLAITVGNIGQSSAITNYLIASVGGGNKGTAGQSYSDNYCKSPWYTVSGGSGGLGYNGYGNGGNGAGLQIRAYGSSRYQAYGARTNGTQGYCKITYTIPRYRRPDGTIYTPSVD